MSDNIKAESLEFAENVQVMTELGFVGTSEESRRFRELWNRLPPNKKENIKGMIYGAVAASAMPQTRYGG